MVDYRLKEMDYPKLKNRLIESGVPYTYNGDALYVYLNTEGKLIRTTYINEVVRGIRGEKHASVFDFVLVDIVYYKECRILQRYFQEHRPFIFHENTHVYAKAVDENRFHFCKTDSLYEVFLNTMIGFPPINANDLMIRRYFMFQRENTCSVCWEEMNELDQLLATKCGHVYHARCIQTWLQTNRTCPLCREEVDVMLFDHHHHYPNPDIRDLD